MSRSRSAPKRRGLTKWNFVKKRDAIQYCVFMRKYDQRWYLVDFDDDLNQGVWSKWISKAYIFKDEEQCVDFCETFLRRREWTIQAIT